MTEILEDDDIRRMSNKQLFGQQQSGSSILTLLWYYCSETYLSLIFSLLSSNDTKLLEMKAVEKFVKFLNVEVFLLDHRLYFSLFLVTVIHKYIKYFRKRYRFGVCILVSCQNDGS